MRLLLPAFAAVLWRGERPSLMLAAAAWCACVCWAGLKVNAKYAADGKFYLAKIDSKVPGGWKVTYQEYGNQEVVPFEYLRAIPKNEDVGTARVRYALLLRLVTCALWRCPQEQTDNFVIPDHLRVLDTDNEKERKRKRKAVKAMKNNYRIHQCVAAVRDMRSCVFATLLSCWRWQVGKGPRVEEDDVDAVPKQEREEEGARSAACTGLGVWV